MKNKVIVSLYFAARYKKLKRKFPSLNKELEELTKMLLENPTLGISLGSNLYKIRMSSKSKGAGKSGGFRVVTISIEELSKGFEITLLTIYDKSEQENFTKDELLKILKRLQAE
jgi:hypothetical protein